MSKIKVYRIELYDALTDEKIVSQRMATRDGAKSMGGKIIESTEIEIDESRLEPGEQSTPKGLPLKFVFSSSPVAPPSSVRPRTLLWQRDHLRMGVNGTITKQTQIPQADTWLRFAKTKPKRERASDPCASRSCTVLTTTSLGERLPESKNS
jgi:hypothetical protein